MSGIEISNLCKNQGAVEAVKTYLSRFRKMMFTINNSEARILVADHTMLDRYTPVISGELAGIDFLVMDFISESIRQLCQERDKEMFEVGPTPEQIAC
jgi:DeoR/GlpR family transcriptional regulator of sugar metabolism